jgi:hypothetical protein
MDFRFASDVYFYFSCIATFVLSQAGRPRQCRKTMLAMHCNGPAVLVEKDHARAKKKEKNRRYTENRTKSFNYPGGLKSRKSGTTRADDSKSRLSLTSCCLNSG